MEKDLEKKYPNTISEYREEIDLFLSDLKNGKNWLDTAERLIEDFKPNPKEADKLEKLYEESLGMIGKDESHYNLTSSEIFFFLYKKEDFLLLNAHQVEKLFLFFHQEKLYRSHVHIHK